MKRIFIGLSVSAAVLVLFYSFSTENRNKKTSVVIKYSCLPCGSDCDSMVYDKPGTCSHCNMPLVDRSTIIHKNIQPDKMCELNEKNILFLDVRTPAEFNGTSGDKFGAIKNAINIPVQDLEARMNELEKYKDKEIIVYCSHSHRSPRASYMLTQNGFKKVTNMLGGMSVWKDQVKKNDCNERLYRQQ
ncbi:MAG TPA: rhodanese-like domain-containing protein [Chitinophagaceae bacterium]|nr:rhodanese-like domain-containing protein [Chitinophagaceae bacterium]